MADPVQLGPFDLLEELGSGAAGTVHRARHRTLGREVALKVLVEPLGKKRRAEWHARLRREAEAAARFDHPNIVRVHALHQEGVKYLLELELVRGESLQARLARSGGRLPPDEALALTETLARALHHLHAAGIVHRDLKPGNVLLDERGAPKIVDFGIAKDLDAEERLSVTGALMGTPSYFSPEQARGAVDEVDGRADVWSLGVILYECLSGKVPYEANSLLELMARIMQTDAPPPRLPWGKTAGAAGEVALRALRRDRDARPTALELAELCAQARRGELAPERAAASGTRSRAGVAGLVALGLVLGAALLVAAVLVAPRLAGRPAGAPAPALAPPDPRAGERQRALAALASSLDGRTAAGRLGRALEPFDALFAEDPGLRAGLANVVCARTPGALAARFGAEHQDPDAAAFAALLRRLDGADLAEPLRAGLAQRRTAIAARLCEQARAELERGGKATAEADAGRARAAGVALLWRAVDLEAELDPATTRAALDLYHLGWNGRFPLGEALEVSALFLALTQAASPFVGAASLREHVAAGRELVRGRTERLELPLAAGLTCLAVAEERVAQDPASREELQALLEGAPLGWLAAFRAGAARLDAAAARRLRALERTAWARALELGLVAPSAKGADPRDEAIAAAEEALALGHPRPDRPALVAASCLLRRARQRLADDPAAAWADLEAAAGHAQGAARFHAQARAEHDLLRSRPHDDAAGARRLALFAASRLSVTMDSPAELATPCWVEAEARDLQRTAASLHAFRPAAESWALERRALEAGVVLNADDLGRRNLLVALLLQHEERALALAHAERLLEVHPAAQAWRKHPDVSRETLEELRDALRTQLDEEAR